MYYLTNKLLIKNKAYFVAVIFAIPGLFISVNLGCLAVIGYFISNIASYNDKYAAEYFIICTDDSCERLYMKEYLCYFIYNVFVFCILSVLELVLMRNTSLNEIIVGFSYSVLGVSSLFAVWKIFGNHHFNQIFNGIVMTLLIGCFFPEYIRISYGFYMLFLNAGISIAILLFTIHYRKTHDVRR